MGVCVSLLVLCCSLVLFDLVVVSLRLLFVIV